MRLITRAGVLAQLRDYTTWMMAAGWVIAHFDQRPNWIVLTSFVLFASGVQMKIQGRAAK